MILRNQIREGVTRDLYHIIAAREGAVLQESGMQLTFLFLENRPAFRRFVGHALDCAILERLVR